MRSERVPPSARVISGESLFARLVVSQFATSEEQASISVGFTAAEIREFVHEYEVQLHGQKGPWLAGRGVSHDRLRRWRRRCSRAMWNGG